jgi:hypothetical protein
MIDVEHIFSLRAVEDVVREIHVNGKSREKILGTKVSEEILSTDKDTLFPLQGVLGFDIAQTLFVGPYVLVVEGPSEFSLLHWFSRQLILREREGLDIRWSICPAEGADKVTSFITLFRGRGLKIAALVDYHQGQKGKIDRLEKSGILQPEHMLKTTTYAEQNEADVEDLLGRELYVEIVNGAMALRDSDKIPEKKPADAPERVVKEVEQHCALLSTGYPEFTHYTAVQYLLNLPDEDAKDLNGLKNALAVFEKLFHDINELI